MKNTILINLENQNLHGNVLDVGFCNYGITYSLFKNGNDEISVDYLEGKNEKEKIEDDFYDSCIVFFALSNIWLKYNRKKVLFDLVKHLKREGVIYIWDLDKPYGRIFNKRLKVVLPGREIKIIKLKELNMLKDTSFESTKKVIEKYFEIIDYTCSDNIYCIKGKKIAYK
ncbi:MAG: class I SAM-dependent methyltransferase [Clostridiaceae bacterium]|nr:class I SAM-dependent methyltransferase [Clostridiaceae bacterium]